MTDKEHYLIFKQQILDVMAGILTLEDLYSSVIRDLEVLQKEESKSDNQ